VLNYIVVKIPLDAVKKDWLTESGPGHIQTLAEHYGVYRDLFNGDYFTPVVNLNVCFDYSDELVTPVYYGNRIAPTEVEDIHGLLFIILFYFFLYKKYTKTYDRNGAVYYKMV